MEHVKNNMDKLLGKSAIDTGASRGIGRDIAIKLSENGALVSLKQMYLILMKLKIL